MKVFSTFHLPGDLHGRFAKKGISYSENRFNRSLTHGEIISEASGCDGLITLLSDRIDSDIIRSLKNCRVIANYAAGYNNIDLTAAREAGIIVTNTPGILTSATAEITFTLILAAARNLVPGEKMMREARFNGWQPELLLGHGLDGKTIGIIGAGRIAQKVAHIALAFGMNVIYHSRSEKPGMPGVFTSLAELMATSDIVSLHIPLNEGTRNLISAPMLDLLKPSAILINTARGEVLDEKHLIELLKAKRVFAAGFDVYENEPAINPELLTLENAVLLPHLGSATFGTREAMAHLAADNVIAVLLGQSPLSPV